MPIKVTFIVSGVDYPRGKRLTHLVYINRTNVAKWVEPYITETEIITEMYFEDAEALERHKTINVDNLITLNTMRSANSMVVTSRTEEVIDTIPYI